MGLTASLDERTHTLSLTTCCKRALVYSRIRNGRPNSRLQDRRFRARRSEVTITANSIAQPALPGASQGAYTLGRHSDGPRLGFSARLRT